MKPYLEYKASGIDWLGEIPSHWKVSKSSWTFDFIGSGTTPTSSEDDYYNNGTINWLQTGDLNDGAITSTSKKITQLAVNDKGLRIYPKGSLVIAMYGATIAKTGILDIDTTVNQACCVLLPSDKTNIKFAFYYFNAAKKALVSFASGGGQPNISQSIISNFTFTVPTIEEQEAISGYLDDVTGKIDTLISEKTAQVEELRAYRSSLITETVTRGLNPDAPLRDSGIDWLGQIPQHWEAYKLKYFIEISNGCDPKTDGDVPVYGTGEKPFKTCGESKPGPTVLLGRKGTIDTPHWVQEDYWNVDTAFDTKVKHGYVLRFFWFVANCLDYAKYSSNTAVPSMTQTAYENMIIPVPSLSEQQEIADFLDEKTAKIDRLIDELTKQLDELAEYKQAIITEAVTGKVDVRDYKPNI